MVKRLITIAETSAFQKRAGKRLSTEEHEHLYLTLATDPTAGELIKGGGGLRKLRLALHRRGKSAGARVIYYFYDESIPLYLLDINAKNEKGDLSDNELRALAGIAKAIAGEARKRRPQ